MKDMLDCGDLYNPWVEISLGYLPTEVLETHKDNLVFISTAQRDACRVARYYCEKREVILLSDRILPKKNANVGQLEVRYFIFAVLHEIVHAIKKHKSPKFDGLTEEQNQAQEEEADNLALEWFNEHIKELNNKRLPSLTKEDIEEAQQKNQKLMEQLYTNV